MKAVLSAAVAFLVTAGSGVFIVPWLSRLKIGQSILEIGPSWHKSKQGTPTMGGIMFVIGILAAVFTIGYDTVRGGDLRHFMALLPALGFGFVGFMDDYIKVVKKRNLGLRAGQKMLAQFIIGSIFLGFLFGGGYIGGEVYLPFINITIEPPIWLYIIIMLPTLTYINNAVNLTDGVDGLCTGVTIPVMLFFTFYAYLDGRTGMLTLTAAAVGGCLGFLLFNFHPAKVFMGDTGSLFLGGLIIGIGLTFNQPVLLILVSLVYIWEALSVVMQVGYFKLTRGKRIFKMAPYHHHLEKSGWKEEKIVYFFTAISALCCVAAAIGALKYFGII